MLQRNPWCKKKTLSCLLLHKFLKEIFSWQKQGFSTITKKSVWQVYIYELRLCWLNSLSAMVLHKRVCGSLALVNMIELVSLYKLQAAHRLSLHPAKIINLFPSDTLSPPPTGWIHFKEPKWTKEPGPFTLVDPKEDHTLRTKKKNNSLSFYLISNYG